MEHENSIKAAIDSIITDWRALQLLGSGATSKYDKNRVVSSRELSQEPRSFGSEMKDVEDLLMRVAKVVTIRREVAEGTRDASIMKNVRKSVLEEPTTTAYELSYIFNIHPDTITRWRREAKQSDDEKEALTATVAETFKSRHTNRNAA